MSQYTDLSIPVSVVGPGTQPGEEDGMQLDYMKMPNDMSVFHAPIIMDDNIESYPVVEDLMNQLMSALANFKEGDDAVRFDFATFEEKDIQFINKFLGEGEVAIIFNEENRQLRIQETVLAGVWRIAGHQDGNIIQAIEVGTVPVAIRNDTFAHANSIITLPKEQPAGTINAPSLLTELSDKSFAYLVGDEAHIVNLTLLPQSPEDLDMLGEYLGEGPTVFLSRGYGSCRVTSTNLKHTWWVQYFNSEDKLILNTLEVVDVPVVTQASIEDIRESSGRITEMVESVKTNDK